MKPLAEKRSNSSLNLDRRTKNFVDDISRYDLNGGEYYISFTDLPKIGVNPRSSYDTPLGIYAYPLTKHTLLQIKTNTVPFAGDAQWANILYITAPMSKIWNMETYTKSDYDRDYSKYFTYLQNVFVENSADEIHEFFSACRLLNVLGSRNSDGAFAWNNCRSAAFAISAARKGNQRDITRHTQFMKDRRYIEHYSGVGVIWNHLLRYMGYDVVIDPGYGIIYGNEPAQTVFLDATTFKILDRFENVNWQDRKTRIITRVRQIPTLLKKGELTTSTALLALNSFTTGVEYSQTSRLNPEKSWKVRPVMKATENEILTVLGYIELYGNDLTNVSHFTHSWYGIIWKSPATRAAMRELLTKKSDLTDEDIMFFGL